MAPARPARVALPRESCYTATLTLSLFRADPTSSTHNPLHCKHNNTVAPASGHRSLTLNE
ncbi:hypothetical protein E2C01_044476 [Portunus trituberculatus]|uniref:Uncharacterized protein n=1 Tax=Portunus trituberculatus TaxID=210409 RepID=A0A5B7FZ49_PORTR|nr:hypothetical protein [Portunus trituberculatus]